MKLNTQPIEKRSNLYGQVLSVHSIFHTIQGEGPFCGTPCVFIRLAGCNLQCPGCDTDYTSVRADITPYDIVGEVLRHRKGGLVVITGGEPFRQNIEPLLVALVREGFYVQIESNGTLPPPPFEYRINPRDRMGVYIVCSPKTGKVNEIILKQACALKYVLQEGDISPADGLPIHALMHTVKNYVERPPKGWNRPIYVQPMDEQDEERNQLNFEATAKSCMDFDYTLQIQVHKVIGVE